MTKAAILILAAGLARAAAPHTPPVEVPAVRAEHPRLVFGKSRTFADVRELYRSDETFRAIFGEALAACGRADHPAMAAACWIVSGDERHARSAARMLEQDALTVSGSGRYSNVWSFALAWDWLHDHPALAGGLRERVAARIAERLHTELARLDDIDMALWHGRNQAANGAMVAALALAGLPGQDVELRRAGGHYAETLKALDFSEGWPEGPSYWIHNRALPYALAADCFLSATGERSFAGIDIPAVMRKIGLWTLYSHGPNGVFEPYGDSVGSLRLGETGMWEASLDYFARLSRDPGVAAGADYLRSRSPAPYGKRPIHWYIALAYDPSARPRAGYDPRRAYLWLRANMPQAMLFGRESMGVAFLRGAWGDPGELFASFKAGDLLAHHDRYDTGHFSIQLGGLLAPLTGIYGGSSYTGAYRLGYAIQTVASNSLLILAPGETARVLAERRDTSWAALSGGQRVISPTGFDCLHLADFKRRLRSGRYLGRASITAFDSLAGRGDYIAADITEAYNSTRFAEAGRAAKVARVTRQFLYLRKERAFVVFDRVETTRPEFLPKFLLHAVSKPRAGEERLLAGHGADNGILEVSGRTVRFDGEGGVLTQRILLPERARTLFIGGPDYRTYVEQDGDQSNGFDGVNLRPETGDRDGGAKPDGTWRVEVEPVSGGASHRFLNVLLPALAGERTEERRVELLPSNAGVVAVRVGNSLAVMSRDGAALNRVAVQPDADLECWVVDAAPGAAYRIGSRTVRASAEGVLLFDWRRDDGSLTLAAPNGH